MVNDQYYKVCIKELRSTSVAALAMREDVSVFMRDLTKDPTMEKLQIHFQKLPAFVEALRAQTRKELRDTFLNACTSVCNTFEGQEGDSSLESLKKLDKLVSDAERRLGKALGQPELTRLGARITKLLQKRKGEQAEALLTNVFELLGDEDTSNEEKATKLLPQVQLLTQSFALVSWHQSLTAQGAVALSALMALIGTKGVDVVRGHNEDVSGMSQLLGVASKLCTHLSVVTSDPKKKAASSEDVEKANLLVQVCSAYVTCIKKDPCPLDTITSLQASVQRIESTTMPKELQSQAPDILKESKQCLLQLADLHRAEEEKKLAEVIVSLQKLLGIGDKDNVDQVVWYKNLKNNATLDEVLLCARGTILKESFAEKLTTKFKEALQVTGPLFRRHQNMSKTPLTLCVGLVNGCLPASCYLHFVYEFDLFCFSPHSRSIECQKTVQHCERAATIV